MRLHPSLLLAALFALAPALSAQTAPGDGADRTLEARDRRQVIDGALAELERSYVFPEVAVKMSAAVRSREAAGEYEPITGAKAFARKLTDDLQAVSRDKHIRVQYRAGGVPSGPGPGAGARSPARRSSPTTSRTSSARRSWAK